jgi:nicotinate dehydrogenase subunit A
MGRYTLTVNGTVHDVTAEPDTMLLPVLRSLGLSGSRFGCGLGQCGACLVLLDGRPVPSCDLPMWSAADRQVTTVEGLAGDDGRPHPVQEAVLAEQAGQCGYCLSGILVAAAALLADNPRPTEADVNAALERNLCRCGVHGRVVRAVVRAGRVGP